MKLFFRLALLMQVFVSAALAQSSIYISDGSTHEPLESVLISQNNEWIGSTDSLGMAIVHLPHGVHRIKFTLIGYKLLDTTIDVSATPLHLELSSSSAALEEVEIIASTRSNQRIENSPIKVEVLGAEELSEEASIKPGNIASILGDVSGVQIQQSSATSGNSNVRVQGLDGRYTQILRDGMPLYDGFSGGFGILSVAPLDLKQIELIKGSASTLYGGGAIGGLVNLISKKPTTKQEIDALINYSTLKEANSNIYLAKRNTKLGYTFFAGYTYQQAVDVNKDGLSDVAKNNGLNIHPKIFFYPNNKTVISLGYSGSFDTRKGGDMLVLENKADAVHQYFETNKTIRHSEEYLVEYFLNNSSKLTWKGNLSHFNRLNSSNISVIEGRQNSFYNELSLFKPMKKSDLVMGLSMVGDDYKTRQPDTALLKAFSNLTFGIFSQYNVHFKEHTTLELGFRLDMHQKYGVFPLPRIAIFHRMNEHWAGRAGFGMGYKVPNPLMQQNYELSLLDILPLNNQVKAEISYGYNAELNYKKEWGKHASLFINQAFFLTQINQPIVFQRLSSGKIDLVNAAAPIVSKGWDSYVKLKLYNWELYLGYTFTDARNTYLNSNTFIALTAKHRAAFVLVKELGEQWRIGIEGSYTGMQYRYDASQTPSYFFLAAMIQRNLGKHIAVVLNGENLLDYRMSKVESIYTGSISNPSFKALWAPIDGRVVNLSIRWKL